MLHDGSVTFPTRDALLDVAAPAARHACSAPARPTCSTCGESTLAPRERGDWPHLRAIQSTGSILFDCLYDWVARPWQARAGAVDLGRHRHHRLLRARPSRTAGLRAASSQCMSLGLDVRACRDGGPRRDGHRRTGLLRRRSRRGRSAFRRCRRRSASTTPTSPSTRALWTHGDFVLELTERGSARILGRSDGILNINGRAHRSGRDLRHPAGLPGHLSTAWRSSSRRRSNSAGSRLVLLVVLAERPAISTGRWSLRIKKELSQRGSVTPRARPRSRRWRGADHVLRQEVRARRHRRAARPAGGQRRGAAESRDASTRSGNTRRWR